MRASHVYISTTSAKRSWFAPVSRARARARTRGQALIELMVALTALVVVTLGVSWLGRLLDMRQAHIAAARALGFCAADAPVIPTPSSPVPDARAD